MPPAWREKVRVWREGGPAPSGPEGGLAARGAREEVGGRFTPAQRKGVKAWGLLPAWLGKAQEFGGKGGLRRAARSGACHPQGEGEGR